MKRNIPHAAPADSISIYEHLKRNCMTWKSSDNGMALIVHEPTQLFIQMHVDADTSSPYKIYKIERLKEMVDCHLRNKENKKKTS